MSPFATDTSDDEINISLRSSEEIAYRTLALATALRRVALESERSSEAKAELFDLQKWSLEQGFIATMSSTEASMLNQPLGAVKEEDVEGMIWQSEGLQALLWAIGIAAEPAPPLAVRFVPAGAVFAAAAPDIQLLLDAVPGPWDPVSPWMKTVRLRDEGEIAVARERAEIRHWLTGAELLWRDSGVAARVEIERATREVLAEAGVAGLLVMGAAESPGDSGRPLASLSAAELSSLAVVTAERLRALNWVCGFGEDWDSTPLDV